MLGTTPEPNPSSTGVAIFKMNGITAIANNNADLWDSIIARPISLDENGAGFSRDTP